MDSNALLHVPAVNPLLSASILGLLEMSNYPALGTRVTFAKLSTSVSSTNCELLDARTTAAAWTGLRWRR